MPYVTPHVFRAALCTAPLNFWTGRFSLLSAHSAENSPVVEDPPPTVHLGTTCLLLQGGPLPVLVMIAMDRFHDGFHHPPGNLSLSKFYVGHNQLPLRRFLL